MPPNFLSLIWLTSLMLAPFSIGIMSCLILQRIYTDKKQEKKEKRKQELTKSLLLYSEKRMDISVVIPAADMPIITDIALELLRMIRGDDRKALIKLLSTLGIEAYHKKKLAKGAFKERLQALEILPCFASDEITTRIKACLQDSDVIIIRAAILALAECRAVNMFPAIVERLREGTLLSSLFMADIFQKFGNEIIPHLLEIVADDATPPSVKIAALSALGRGGHFEATPVLLELAAHASADIRAESYAALSRLGDPRAEGVLKQGLKDSEWRVREQAALCAGALRSTRVMTELHALLSDKEWGVRFHAAESLFLLGPKGITLLSITAAQPTQAGHVAQLLLAEKGEMV